MFFKPRIEKVKERKLDEQFLTIVAEELESNIKHKASWAKAISDSNGNNDKAQSYYIKYRVQSLKDDYYLQQEMDITSEKHKENPTTQDEDLPYVSASNFTKVSRKPKIQIHPLITFFIVSILIITFFRLII